MKEVSDRASKAVNKPSPIGPDIDLRQYLEYEGVPGKVRADRIQQVGIDLAKAMRSAYYLQIDNKVVGYLSRLPGVEITTIEDVINNQPDIAKEYIFKLIPPDKDKYVALVALKGKGGYFIRVKKNVKVDQPIQTCLFMSSGGFQAPHNIIILEEGASANVLTGCTIMPESFGLHAGMTEFYVGRNARLSYIMVHAWNRVTHVRPRSAANLGDNAEMISYYMNLSNVKTLQMFPTIYLSGEGSKVYSSSILLSRGDSYLDVGSEAVLNAYGSKAELVARVVSKDISYTIARARLVGNAGKGHIECKGLVLDDSAKLITVPELKANSTKVELTHEASIGKIAEEAILYLVSRGLKKEEAEALIVRGFMNIEIKGLNETLKNYIKGVLDLMAKASL
jgi:hypothetical protein